LVVPEVENSLGVVMVVVVILNALVMLDVWAVSEVSAEGHAVGVFIVFSR
jgi:hypothetical protein